MPDAVRVEAELRELEARLDAARVQGDLAAFEEVLAPEFRTIAPNGEVSFREQMLANTASGAFVVRSSRSTDLVIRALGEAGDTAVVSGRAHLEASVDGRDISGVYAYTHVYVLRDGRWQVVAAQSTAELKPWLFFVAARIARMLRRSA
jgi:ketosteroid isomerase-like protein